MNESEWREEVLDTLTDIHTEAVKTRAVALFTLMFVVLILVASIVIVARM
jgi:hypothetical protein